MFPRDVGCEFAILAVMCTIAIFLFPAACGPYSAVHGPATALLSVRGKLKLLLTIALAALHLSTRVRPNGMARLCRAWQKILLSETVPPVEICILRC